MFSLNLLRKRVPGLLLGQAVFLLAILLLVPRYARSQVPSLPAWVRDDQTQAVDHLDSVVIDRSEVPVSPTWERDNQTQAVDHLDPVVIDATLSLPKLIDLTMQKYPDTAWLTSLEEEAAAIAERSKSWTAGASYASIGYQSISTFRLNYATGSVQVPLWNLGQRDAEHKLADQSETSAEAQAVAIKLRVAGLVRGALWDMALAKVHYDQAQVDLDTYEKLLATIKRYVEVGDLPRANELMAQSELLQKRSAFTMAEA
ncbi:MAG: TolC family protein, partial [Methylococcaceae bacterium]|nr:TolC family protein [Methylococcaceae bacterium]